MCSFMEVNKNKKNTLLPLKLKFLESVKILLTKNVYTKTRYNTVIFMMNINLWVCYHSEYHETIFVINWKKQRSK